MKMGVCPRCQASVVVDKVSGNCTPHFVCNNHLLGDCDGSVNTEPEATYEIGGDVEGEN